MLTDTHRLKIFTFLIWSSTLTKLAAIDEINSLGEEPEFVEQIENATVSVGRSVKLSCYIRNLGAFKVAWMHFEQSAILTVNKHVITRNPRITVTHDEHRAWNLHINNVQEADRGRYMCQLNTISPKTQFGYLNVVVPPNIDDSVSSSDVIVREGANVTLTCHASGFPTPTVKWKREDGSNITLNKTHSVSEWEGNQVSLVRISRLDMGAYLCIASNGVPPSVSKTIKVSVDFPPQLLIPHQLVGVPIGSYVTLECFTEAHPTSLNYWTRGDSQMLHESKKYHSENIPGTPSFKVHMKLTINDVSKEDLDKYKCVAKNPRGETDGTIRIYASEQTTTTAASTTASTTARPKYLEIDKIGHIANEENDLQNTLYNGGGKNNKNSGSKINLVNKSDSKMRGTKGALSKNHGSSSYSCLTNSTIIQFLLILVILRVNYEIS